MADLKDLPVIGEPTPAKGAPQDPENKPAPKPPGSDEDKLPPVREVKVDAGVLTVRTN